MIAKMFYDDIFHFRLFLGKTKEKKIKMSVLIIFF